MNRLDGKIAIVTGGASGIGRATARMFREAGARLVVADVADGQAVAAELDGTFILCDVTDPDAVNEMFARVKSDLGRVDILFNNAGIERHGPLVDVTPEDHRRVMDIDLNGVFFCLQAAIRSMSDNEGPMRGSIINTASVAGLVGCPGLSSYNAAKGAVVMLTKNAALEVGNLGIRVNAVCPGIIRTPMASAFDPTGSDGGMDLIEAFAERAHPLGRMGEPEDVAKLVTFLASDDASFISGAAIPIDGAMTAGFPASAEVTGG
ncbi:MAG: NAD(P)-dependent dehydrogenase (short-subunit alcohol dehydrogenase family) [Hyphomicrobiaceae bacterium]|jgi:NAD(P)-dependent dehydrogenase (short-subunit alcohol dehydrogenase family)